jgi:hypothetical protein
MAPARRHTVGPSLAPTLGLMKPTLLRRAVFKHGLKTWGLMLALFTPIILLSDYMPGWLFYLLFFGVFFLVLMPVHFGIGPLGRRFGREVNDAAVLEDKEYRLGLGPQANQSNTEHIERKK